MEKYKITKEPWPWDKDPENWKEKRNRMLGIYLRNYVVITPLINILVDKTTNNAFKYEDWPSWFVN